MVTSNLAEKSVTKELRTGAHTHGPVDTGQINGGLDRLMVSLPMSNVFPFLFIAC